MIRHCVFVHFRETVSEAEISGLLEEVAGLKAHVPGITEVHIGANVSPESGMDKGYGNGFIMDFDSPASRDRYLADERHQQVGAKLVAAAVGGAAGILVYDMQI
jgi:hypothetical protein